MLAFQKERSNFDQQGDKGTFLENKSMGCIKAVFFSGKGMEIQDM